MRLIIATTLILNSLGLSQMSQASSDHAHSPLNTPVTVNTPVRANSTAYSCNLREHSNQCREYSIDESHQHMITVLREGCQSMNNGKFKASKCTPSSRTGRCLKITRDYHNPNSLIYDNHYYPGKKNDWTRENVERVCEDLGGTFIAK